MLHTETYHSHTQGNHQEDVQTEVDKILCNAGRQRGPAALPALSEYSGSRPPFDLLFIAHSEPFESLQKLPGTRLAVHFRKHASEWLCTA